MNLRRDAFSLVELSIVLVILGLLVGGVLSGQSLIHAAELRAIGTEQGKYYAAVNTFKDKYFGVPGDLANGYQFWATNCGTNDKDERTGCNGDGDGVIRSYGAEDARAFRHLAFAGLVEGSYTTTAAVILMTSGPGNTGYVMLTPDFLPKSKFGSNYWIFSDIWRFTQCYQCNLGYSSIVLATGDLNTQMVASSKLSLSDAWSIDTKLDDGRAGSGTIHGTNNGTCIDASASDPYSIAAKGAETTNACMLHFMYKL